MLGFCKSRFRLSSNILDGEAELGLAAVVVRENNEVGDVVVVEGVPVASVVEGSNILDMYRIYHSSMLLMLDAEGIDVVVGVVAIGSFKLGLFTRTVFINDV